MQTVETVYVDKAISYAEYRALVDELVEQEKTTGTDQSELKIRFTKLNAQRMKRLDKQVSLTEEVKKAIASLERPLKWIVLTEGWCGDAAQILPVLQAMVNESNNIEMYLLLRDEHPELMDQFLTNGTKSIPKLICLDGNTGEVIGSWGPRPVPAQEMVLDYKKNPAVPYEEFSKNLQLWYTKDKAIHTQEEMVQKIREWGKMVNK